MEQERVVNGVAWGMALAHDSKGRARRKWDSIRRKATRDPQSKGLTGAALEAAVLAIAGADPSLVRIEAAGA